MTVHRVSLDQFARDMDRIGKTIEAAMVRGLRSAGNKMVGMVVEEIDTASPRPANDTGELRGSVDATNIPGGSLVSVDAPHAPMLEYGTRPHWAPLAPLVAWVIRKRLVDGDEEPEEIARAIQQSIARFGTEPRHYFRKAFAKIGPVVQREVERELSKI